MTRRSLWRRIGRDLLVLAVALGVAVCVLIVGDLIAYGQVNW